MNGNGEDLGSKIDQAVMTEIAEAGPQKLGEIADRLLSESPAQFPEFGMYAVYDKAMRAYVEPQFYVNDGVAWREFGSLLRTRLARFAENPDDYLLDCVGCWNQATGIPSGGEVRTLGSVREVLNAGESF